MNTYVAQVGQHGTSRVYLDSPKPWHLVTDDGDSIVVTGSRRKLVVPLFEVSSEGTWQEIGDDHVGIAAGIAHHIVGAVAERVNAMTDFKGDSLVVFFCDLPTALLHPTGFNIHSTVGMALCQGEPTFDEGIEALKIEGVWKPSVEDARAAARQVPAPKRHRNGHHGRKSQRQWVEQVAATLVDALLAVPS